MEDPISQRLRSRNVENNGNATNETAEPEAQERPSKRSARLMTENSDAMTTKTQEQPAKRTSRRAMTLDGRDENKNASVANTRKKRIQNENVMSIGDKFDAISALVKTNCQLTNDLIMTKKQLYASMNDCTKIQTKWHELDVAYTELVAKNEEMAMVIRRYESKMFCDNLIDLESDAVQTGGEYTIKMKKKY